MTESYEPDVSAGLIFVVVIALLLFFFSLRNLKHKQILFIITGMLAWLMLQAFISYSGFYKNLTSIIPRIGLASLSALAAALLLSLRKNMLPFFNLRMLTVVQTLRLLLALILLSLYYDKQIPVEMTFFNLNVDVLIGITALPMSLKWFNQHVRGLRILMGWNILGILLLINMMLISALSFPSGLQIFGSNQPNNAIIYFPFSWIPAFLSPLALFAHLVSIRKIKARLKDASTLPV
ncbi:MAG: hypothetical protein LC117_09495 [Bacteroidia bacterium]|nr:hypothetical protein [Bacteroidia bacterium]MCZ2278147.1 hypothetical protein [Bacteroidia bacterium]